MSDVVTEKHLIDALMDDPDVEVSMAVLSASPVVDATLVDVTPEPVAPVEVPVVTEEWLEEGEDELPDEKPIPVKPKPVPRKRSN